MWQKSPQTRNLWGLFALMRSPVMTEPTSPLPPSAPSRAPGRFWTFVRILNVRLRFIFLMVVVGLIAGHWDTIMNYVDRWRRPVHVVQTTAEEIEYYCPMHPNIIRAEPGNCPICGMPLAERAKTARQALPEGVLARVQLTPEKILIGRIATSPVAYELLSREIRTVGIVDYDETKRAFIAARIKGRLDQLMVNYVGQHVEQGDPLASIYSPDLLIAQRELIETVQSLKAHPPAPGGKTGAEAIVEGARRKLLLWGITEAQIDDILARGTPETHLTIYSPISGIVTEKNVLEGRYVNEGDVLYTIADLSRVWLQVKIFDDQMAGIAVGQAVEVTSAAFPNEIFAGRIAFISYTVDPATRTVAARVEVANPDYKLRPGMYVSATVRLPVGEIVEVPPPASGPTSSASLEPALAKGIADLTQAYLTLTTAYTHDKTDDDAARQLAQAARTLAGGLAKDERPAAGAIADGAASLLGKELKVQRTAFKELSAQVIALLRIRPPAEPSLFVAHCPMVDADWLQTSQQIANPYYGSEMLTCGTITGPLKSGTPTDARFATGYFCPIYPERLYDKPQHCPIDGFPLKYVKISKVPAVPQSAVIDTGTHKIVYRESAPGVFDMLAVQLGPRAGEFYPLLDGLEVGDRVATVGTFLVDAENRLNPAAAAQYFGAGGGQSPSGHQN
jgi:membrane fusion protein, copper/silver efflux system